MIYRDTSFRALTITTGLYAFRRLPRVTFESIILFFVLLIFYAAAALSSSSRLYFVLPSTRRHAALYCRPLLRQQMVPCHFRLHHCHCFLRCRYAARRRRHESAFILDCRLLTLSHLR